MKEKKELEESLSPIDIDDSINPQQLVTESSNSSHELNHKSNIKQVQTNNIATQDKKKKTHALLEVQYRKKVEENYKKLKKNRKQLVRIFQRWLKKQKDLTKQQQTSINSHIDSADISQSKQNMIRSLLSNNYFFVGLIALFCLILCLSHNSSSLNYATSSNHFIYMPIAEMRKLKQMSNYNNETTIN